MIWLTLAPVVIASLFRFWRQRRATRADADAWSALVAAAVGGHGGDPSAPEDEVGEEEAERQRHHVDLAEGDVEQGEDAQDEGDESKHGR